MKSILFFFILFVNLCCYNVQAATITWVAIGDSLTYGENDEIWSQFGLGYPARVAETFIASGNSINSQNLGIPGLRSDEVINYGVKTDEPERWASQDTMAPQLTDAETIVAQAPAGNRKIVTVWIGSNNIFQSYLWGALTCENDPTPTCHEAVTQIFSSDINTILSRLQNTGAEVYIATLDDHGKRPLNDFIVSAQARTGMTDLSNRFNQVITQKAGQYGGDIVDLYNTTIFENPATLSADGNHPNSAGYTLLGGIWYDALNNAAAPPGGDSDSSLLLSIPPILATLSNLSPPPPPPGPTPGSKLNLRIYVAGESIEERNHFNFKPFNADGSLNNLGADNNSEREYGWMVPLAERLKLRDSGISVQWVGDRCWKNQFNDECSTGTLTANRVTSSVGGTRVDVWGDEQRDELEHRQYCYDVAFVTRGGNDLNQNIDPAQYETWLRELVPLLSNGSSCRDNPVVYVTGHMIDGNPYSIDELDFAVGEEAKMQAWLNYQKNYFVTISKRVVFQLSASNPTWNLRHIDMWTPFHDNKPTTAFPSPQWWTTQNPYNGQDTILRPDLPKMMRDEGGFWHPRRLASIYAGEIVADQVDIDELRRLFGAE